MTYVRGTRGAIALAAAAVLTAAVTSACVPGTSDSADGKTMNILVFSGDPGALIKKASKGFEEEYDVTINWTEGSGSSNFAKVVAGAGHQQYDIVFTGETQVTEGTEKGVLAEVDNDIVDTSHVFPELLYAKTSVPIGLNETVMFYNEDLFKQNGWEPPTDWGDVLDPKYCGKVGLSDVSVIYGAHTVLGLGGLTKEDAAAGNIQPAFDRGLKLIDKNQDCIDNFETDAATLSQKMQGGQAVIGTNGSTRTFPIMLADVPLKVVKPETGAIANISSAAATKGGPNPELAQQFLNWMLSDSSQKLFVEEGKFGPATDAVELTQEDIDLGVPSPAEMDSIVVVDPDALYKVLPTWTSEFHETVG